MTSTFRTNQVIAARDDAELADFEINEQGTQAVLIWNVAGKSELAFVDLRTEKASSAPPLPTELAFAPKFSRDGRQLALVLNGAAAPSDVRVLDLASHRFHQVTHSPHAGINIDNLIRPQLVHYSANDGLPLSAWLWLPKHWSPPGPVVLSFHGGPEGEELPGFRNVLFPDEGHGWRKVPNRIQSTVEITRWFVKYLGEPKQDAAKRN